MKKLIAIFTIIFAYLTTSNFLKFDDNFLNKKVNLGLDLQGGSYLLLEVDSKPIINQNLQQKLLKFRKYLQERNIEYQNLKIINSSIRFLIKEKDIETFEEFFLIGKIKSS